MFRDEGVVPPRQMKSQISYHKKKIWHFSRNWNETTVAIPQRTGERDKSYANCGITIIIIIWIHITLLLTTESFTFFFFVLGLPDKNRGYAA